jgi:prevent-host-death family protein
VHGSSFGRRQISKDLPATLNAHFCKVTIYGYNMVMKQVGIAELKARLSEYLRSVRRGGTVTVLDRNTPIARIIPVRQPGLRVRKPGAGTPRPNQIVVPPSELQVDVLELLLKERQGHR